MISKGLLTSHSVLSTSKTSIRLPFLFRFPSFTHSFIHSFFNMLSFTILLAASALTRTCHPTFLRCHHEFDGRVRLIQRQMPCQVFSWRQIYAVSDSRSHPNCSVPSFICFTAWSMSRTAIARRNPASCLIKCAMATSRASRPCSAVKEVVPGCCARSS